MSAFKVREYLSGNCGVVLLDGRTIKGGPDPSNYLHVNEAERIVSCLEACRALPDPERDVAALLEFAQAYKAEMDEARRDAFDSNEAMRTATRRRVESAIAVRALLARINQEPPK